jgi:hypothetical protein
MLSDGDPKTGPGSPAAFTGAVPSRAGGLRINWPLLLFLGGIVVGFLQFWHSVGYGLGPGHEMAQIARNITAGRGFSDPLHTIPTGPTASEPPLYPLFLALLMKLFGISPLMVIVLVLLMIVPVNALVAALMPRMSAELFGTRVPGVFAGIFSILSARVIPEWDADCTQLGLITLALTTAFLLRRHVRPSYSGAFAGAVCGLVFLLNPASALVSGACVAFLLIPRRLGLRHTARFAAAFLAGAAILVSPWFVRNYRLWGTLTSRTNFGMTLHASNNDCTEPSMAMDLRSGCYDSTHPNASVPEARLLLKLGESAYNQRKTAEAVAWIRAHPSRFAWLTWNRFIQFWLPYPMPPSYSCYAIWAITVLSIPGLIWMALKRERTTALIVAVFLLYPPIYYIVVSDVRYRIPILWLSCLAAGYFASSLLQLWPNRRARRFAAA